MSLPLKYFLNPTFALVFAVGVDRFFRLLDRIFAHEPGAEPFVPSVESLAPFVLVLATLLMGVLAAISNDRLVEKEKGLSPVSFVAWLTYISILCILAMFYFATKIELARWWALSYAMLCAVNAIWNAVAVHPATGLRHVVYNAALCIALFAIVWRCPICLGNGWFALALVGVIGVIKWLQRRGDKRFQETDPAQGPALRIAGRPLRVAHRIATEADIQRAAKARCDGVETDVQITKDGAVIIFHDETTLVGSERRQVAALRFDELSDPQRQPAVMTLEAVLASIQNGHVKLLLLDVKSDAAIDSVIALIRRADAVKRVVIASFNYKVLQHVRRRAPEIAVMLTVGWSRVARTPLGLFTTLWTLSSPVMVGRVAEVQGLLLRPSRITSRALTRARAAGLTVWAWGLGDEGHDPRADDLRARGVEGFVVDLPREMSSEPDPAVTL